MDSTTSVVLAGVGGQGVLLVSEMLALAAIEAGYDAKQTEDHGVSQRGGSVSCHVRYGPIVYSPLVTAGQADAVVGLEKLEGLRYAHYLREGGTLVVNTHEILPLSAGPAASEYPQHAIEFLRARGLQVMDIAATNVAVAMGEVRAANVVLLGALSTCLNLPAEVWNKILRQRVPKKYLSLNQLAFAEGVRLAAGHAYSKA